MPNRLMKLFTLSTAVILLMLVILLVLPSSTAAQLTPEAQIQVDETIIDVDWSPDSSLLAVAGTEGIRIYDVNLNELTRTQDYNNVYAITWNPASNQLASSSTDGTIKIWDYKTTNHTLIVHTILPVGEPDRFFTPLAWSPDGDHLAGMIETQPQGFMGVVGKINIWNTTTWELELELPTKYVDPLGWLVWSPDSTKIAGAANICGSEFQCLQPYYFVLDLTTSESQIWGKSNANINSLSWSSNGKLAIATDEITIRDSNARDVVSIWEGIGNQASFEKWLDWSPDGEKLVIGGRDGGLSILDAATGAILLDVATSGLSDLDWSSDGNQVATVGFNGEINIWDVSHLPSVSGIPTLTPYPTRMSTPNN